MDEKNALFNKLTTCFDDPEVTKFSQMKAVEWCHAQDSISRKTGDSQIGASTDINIYP
jgi:hypothetical protein